MLCYLGQALPPRGYLCPFGFHLLHICFSFTPARPPKGKSAPSVIWFIICLIVRSLQDLDVVEANDDEVRLCHVLTWAHSAPSLPVL